MNKRETLGEIVRRERLSLGLTQERVAELADIHRNYVGDIERNLKEPTISVFVRLCRAVGLEPAAVLKAIVGQMKSK